MDPVLAVVIIVALVCITTVAVVIVRRRNPALPLAGSVEPRAIEVRPPAPALQEITFKEALESDALAGGLEELSKRQVEYALGLQSSNATVQAVSLAERQDGLVITYEFSRSGALVPQSGEAVIPLDGSKFARILKDAKTGQVTELTRTAPPAGAKSANAAGMLKGVAHVISGIDVLRDLKEIDRKLSAMAEGRTIDQLAEMETIYNRLSEVFSRPDWMERRAELTASRDQLYKLRAIWRRELEKIVDSAPETPDTQAAEDFAKLGGVFFPPAYFVGKSLEMVREAEEQKLFGHLATTADLMQRIRLAMLLDVSVSQALGEAETLAGVAMRNELEMWDGIVEKFQSKRDGIRTFAAPGDLQTVEDALQGYVALLATFTTMQKSCARAAHERRQGSSRAGSSASRFAELAESEPRQKSLDDAGAEPSAPPMLHASAEEELRDDTLLGGGRQLRSLPESTGS